MFNADFWPTPAELIPQILNGIELKDKIILEPSAGYGNIIDHLQTQQIKEVIACEKDARLRTVLESKCRVIKDDFLKVTKEEISHVDLVVMNPPFSGDERHILHAWDIAPDGCEIIALCNWETLNNTWNASRRNLKKRCEESGLFQNLGQVFKTAERSTEVEIGLIRLFKPASDYKTEFNGFFMDEDETPEDQTEGLLPYDAIKDLVGRYIGAVKMFDKQLETAYEMNNLTALFGGCSVGFSCSTEQGETNRNSYKKALQKSAWKYIFNLMKMDHLVTSSVKEDINKFIETQEKIPFTERNIYHMLDMVFQTREQTMDKAIIEVFDKLTKHHHDNRYNLEGWKTNSYYMLNEKFILGWITERGWSGEMKVRIGGNSGIIDDLNKALCYLTGTKHEPRNTLYNFCSIKYEAWDFEENLIGSSNHGNKQDLEWSLMHKGFKKDEYTIISTHPKWGQWTEWGFFEVKGYKKGTMHFRFKDRKVWEMLNQRIAKIKGYPLHERANAYYESKVA